MTQRSFDEVPNIVLQDNDRVVPKASTPPPPPVQNSSSNGLAVFALLLGFAASGLSGYLFWQNTTQSELLKQSELRIADLENRLSATGEEMGNSTVALQVKVTELSNRAEELWDQMDKLWASAWRRNQKDIKDLNQKFLTGQANDKNARDKIATGATKSVNAVDKKFDSLQNEFNATLNDILAVNLELEGVKQGLLTSQNTSNVLNDKIAILEQRNASLKAKVASLEKNIKTIQPATP